MFKQKREILSILAVVTVMFIAVSSFGAVKVLHEKVSEKTPPEKTTKKASTEKVSRKAWPEKAMVGYIDLKSEGAVAKLEQHPDKLSAYNVVVFAFTEKDGTLTKGNEDRLKKLLSVIDHEKTILLLSIGGEHAVKLDFGHATVHNLIEAVDRLKLDGVDFDVENILEADKLVQLAKDLRKEKSNLYITAAPQLAGESKKPDLVIAGVNMAWDFKSGVYDYVFVQAYNTGTKFFYPNPLDDDKLIDETDPDIIAAAYHGLYQNKVVNPKTKIIIGIPCNAGAAPTMCNIWNNRKTAAEWDTAVKDIKHNLDCIYTGKFKMDPKQFGGLMTWSILNDTWPDAWPPDNDPSRRGVDQKAKNAPEFYFTDNVASHL